MTTKENGKTIFKMEKASSNGQMVLSTKENGNKVNKMEVALSDGQTVISTKENGKTGEKMEEALLDLRMGKFKQVFGSKVKCSNDFMRIYRKCFGV